MALEGLSVLQSATETEESNLCYPRPPDRHGEGMGRKPWGTVAGSHPRMLLSPVHSDDLSVLHIFSRSGLSPTP